MTKYETKEMSGTHFLGGGGNFTRPCDSFSIKSTEEKKCSHKVLTFL